MFLKTQEQHINQAGANDGFTRKAAASIHLHGVGIASIRRWLDALHASYLFCIKVGQSNTRSGPYIAIASFPPNRLAGGVLTYL